MKAKLLADDSIELDGSPEEITRVMVETYAKARTVIRGSDKPLFPEGMKLSIRGTDEGPAVGTARKPRKTHKRKASSAARKGPKIASVPKPHEWTSKDDETLIVDLKNGRKPPSIAKTFGVRVGTIYNKINRLKKQGRLPRAGDNKTT